MDMGSALVLTLAVPGVSVLLFLLTQLEQRQLGGTDHTSRIPAQRHQHGQMPLLQILPLPADTASPQTHHAARPNPSPGEAA